MQNNMKPKQKVKRRAWVFAPVVAAVCLYLVLCVILYLRAQEGADIESGPADMTAATSAVKIPFFRFSEYYRGLAEKLPYYPHDPEIVPRLYGSALLKSPADYEIFLSYASYLADKDCCPQKVLHLINESVRRAPTNPRMYRAAAAYLVSTRSLNLSIPFIRKAIELQPSSASELYRLLQQNGAEIPQLFGVTPQSADALIQLSNYLASEQRIPVEKLQELLTKLDTYPLTPHQRIMLGQLALRIGLSSYAENHAKKLLDDPQNRIQALAILAEVSWKKKDLAAWDQFVLEIEQEYMRQGLKQQAATESFNAAVRLWHSGERAHGRERLLQVAENYPSFPQVYRFLADASRNESKQLELHYLRKAVEIDPANGEFRRDLAIRLTENQEYNDAERMFRELTILPGFEVSGYIGLSYCCKARGDFLQAIRILEEAEKNHAGSEALLMELGAAYLAVGESRKADAAFEKVLLINPENQTAAEALRQ
jgi:Flp pilus assembly protein TadD